MKAKVIEDKCIGCGQCTYVCDQVFEITDEGVATVIIDEINEEWCYEESESEFHLYLQGRYNSNNFSVQILKFDLDKELKLEDKELI